MKYLNFISYVYIENDISSYGYGHCDVPLDRKILSYIDIELIEKELIKKNGFRKVCIMNWKLYDELVEENK